MRPPVLTSQKGVSMIEILLWLAVFASVALFAANQFTNVNAGALIERAYAEIEKVRTAAQAYRSSPRRAGSYVGISVEVLATQGYNIRPLTNGTGENAYGRNITLVSDNDGADATLTYETGVEEACQQLIERFTNAAGINGTPSCATGTLTLIVD